MAGVGGVGGGGGLTPTFDRNACKVLELNQGVVKALIDPKDTLLDRIPNYTAIITLIVVRYFA